MRELESMQEWHDLLGSTDQLIVIDYYTNWCGPCKQLMPQMLILEQNYPNVIFVKANIEEVKDFATQHNVKALPTIKFVKNSKLLAEINGANTIAIKQNIEKYQ